MHVTTTATPTALVDTQGGEGEVYSERLTTPTVAASPALQAAHSYSSDGRHGLALAHPPG
jgi:hypothetical protein